MTKRFQYNPAILLGMLLEDTGEEIDWDKVYKAAERINEIEKKTSTEED